MNQLLLIAALILAIGSENISYSQTTIATTSFEEGSTGDRYTDTGDAAQDHALINNELEAEVNFISTENEIGFSAYYFNTRDNLGLTDGDFFGFTAFTGNGVNSYPDGIQGYQMSDSDGAVELTFDTVNLTGFDYYRVSLSFLFQATGYEPDDSVHIMVINQDSIEQVLLSIAGQQITDTTGNWYTIGTDVLEGSAVLKVYFDTNSGSESLFLDRIKFQGSNEVFVRNEFQAESPHAILLSPAYPNPFNPQTQFSVTLAQTQNVTIDVFNTLGQQIANLHNGQLTAGISHNFTFNANSLPSGLYLYRVSGKQVVTTRTFFLIK